MEASWMTVCKANTPCTHESRRIFRYRDSNRPVGSSVAQETNFRFCGDLAGLESKLDYLAGMGIKAIFASGTPWINMLWQADSDSALHSQSALGSTLDD
ncbi:hypothetical protein BDM02DRAFT_1252045 [Thelephora ganbajun]|uniref:Uncharacterized protein n=1 Tax=Thelephora ganbajun TaxID=370292 RepID=A0ACB6ZMK0_THEGA|nr:hypothetical protein BDM02DRAFT_1252045 [Thelephora ganbajun]